MVILSGSEWLQFSLGKVSPFVIYAQLSTITLLLKKYNKGTAKRKVSHSSGQKTDSLEQSMWLNSNKKKIMATHMKKLRWPIWWRSLCTVSQLKSWVVNMASILLLARVWEHGRAVRSHSLWCLPTAVWLAQLSLCQNKQEITPDKYHQSILFPKCLAEFSK